MSSLAILVSMSLLASLGMAADISCILSRNLSDATLGESLLNPADLSSPDLADATQVIWLSDDEIIELPITGGIEATESTTRWSVRDLKQVLESRVEPENLLVNKEAIALALRYPGDLTIGQIDSIYSYIKNGDGLKKGWGYVRDPRGIDFFRYANASIETGIAANRTGGGDCDDYAILMASLVESIGGTTRIILGYNRNKEGHAFCEVYIGQIYNNNNQIEEISKWLRAKYNTEEIYIDVDETGDAWLNLDYGMDKKGRAHPGGPLYKYDKYILLYINNNASRTALRVEIDDISVLDQLSKEWNVTFGGIGGDFGTSVIQDNNSYIVLGFTQSNSSWRIRPGDEDIWLIKTDQYGKELWNKTFGGPNQDVGEDLQKTDDGGYIIAGWTVSYGSGNQDAWLIKVDSEGREAWNYVFGGSGSDFVNSVRQTNDRGYILAGQTWSYGEGNGDLWLIKTNSEGKEEWKRTYGGTLGDGAYSVQESYDGGYLVVGQTFSFGSGGSDLWIIKTDSNGNKEWDKTLGGTGFDIGRDIQVTNKNNYIIIGYTDLKSYGVSNDMDLWIIKIDPIGNILWKRTYDGPAREIGLKIKELNDGGYIILSRIEDENKILIVKTNSNGEKEWMKEFSGSINCEPSLSIQQTSDLGYIITGTRMNLDADIWLMKLKPESELLRKENDHNQWELLQFYDSAINSNPLSIYAWREKGLALRDLKKYDDALICFNKILELSPQDTIAWNNKAICLSKLNRSDEALQCFDRAIEYAKDESDISAYWDNKGNFLFELGKSDEALDAFDKAIKSAPRFENPKFDKIVALKKLGREDEMVEMQEEYGYSIEEIETWETDEFST